MHYIARRRGHSVSLALPSPAVDVAIRSITAARRHWRWYLPGRLFLPRMVIGQEAAWASQSVPRAEWVLPPFALMPGIAGVPRWRGQSRFNETVV